jgi:collagenase-like PrtC family protease
VCQETNLKGVDRQKIAGETRAIYIVKKVMIIFRQTKKCYEDLAIECLLKSVVICIIHWRFLAFAKIFVLGFEVAFHIIG